MALYKKQSKEYKDLEKIVVEYESYLKIITGLKEAKNIYEKEKDIEFRGLAKKETEEFSRPWKRFFSQPTAIEYNTAVLEEEYEVK